MRDSEERSEDARRSHWEFEPIAGKRVILANVEEFGREYEGQWVAAGDIDIHWRKTQEREGSFSVNCPDLDGINKDMFAWVVISVIDAVS